MAFITAPLSRIVEQYVFYNENGSKMETKTMAILCNIKHIRKNAENGKFQISILPTDE